MIFPLLQVSQCIRLLTRQFTRERREVGLHGLYAKYQAYCQPLASFMSLLSHLLVMKSIVEEVNENADKRE
jgi:hypothetical protein